MLKKNYVLLVFAGLMTLVVVAAYAAYTSNAFIANGDAPGSWDETNAELYRNNLHFGNGVDAIWMSGGDDWILMGDGNDTIKLAGGSDKIDFYGNSNTTETMQFDENGNSYVKWTGSNGNVEIKVKTGDFVIKLAE